MKHWFKIALLTSLPVLSHAHTMSPFLLPEVFDTKAAQSISFHRDHILGTSLDVVVQGASKQDAMVEKTVTMGFVGSLLYGLLPKIVYLFRQQQQH